MKRTTYLLVWTVALSSLVSCVAGNVAVDVEPVIDELEPEPVVEVQELDEPEAAVVEEEPATDDSAEQPAQSVELAADAVLLTHADAIALPGDEEDWVAFTTAPVEGETAVTWVTFTCTREGEAVNELVATLWDNSQELSLNKFCSPTPKFFELEPGHTYQLNVRFRDEGESEVQYTLTVSHTTQGLTVEDGAGDGGGPLSPSGIISWPGDHQDIVEMDSPVSEGESVDLWAALSCVGDTEFVEAALGRATGTGIGSVIETVACNEPPKHFRSAEDHPYLAAEVGFTNAEVPMYVEWTLTVTLTEP